MGDNCSRHAEEAKDVRIELGASLLVGDFFHCAADLETGVVDQNVDGASVFKDALNCAVDGLVTEDVELNDFQ
jgi:hypothetical protein